jgi:hypothetical protein
MNNKEKFEAIPANQFKAFLEGAYECSKEYADLVKENERLKQIEKEYYKLLKLEFENSGVKFNEKGQVSSIVNVTVEFQEYKQLKRLEENVQIKIEAYRYSLKKAQSNKFYTKEEFKKIQDYLELLESLRE